MDSEQPICRQTVAERPVSTKPTCHFVTLKPGLTKNNYLCLTRTLPWQSRRTGSLRFCYKSKFHSDKFRKIFQDNTYNKYEGIILFNTLTRLL